MSIVTCWLNGTKQRAVNMLKNQAIDRPIKNRPLVEAVFLVGL
ncbi:hypothetical protein [Moraxella lacunata]